MISSSETETKKMVGRTQSSLGRSLLYEMCGCQGAEKDDTISGGNGEGVPPVPIPNTEVKTFSADGPWLDTARESRSPPDSKSRERRATSPFSHKPQ